MSVTAPSPADRALRRLEREHREEADARRAVWAFLWCMFVFKIATVLIIGYVAAGSGESLSMILATTWYWLIIPVAAISGPLLYRWRRIQVRKRRERLLAAEFATEPHIVMLHEWNDGDGGSPPPRR